VQLSARQKLAFCCHVQGRNCQQTAPLELSSGWRRSAIGLYSVACLIVPHGWAWTTVTNRPALTHGRLYRGFGSFPLGRIGEHAKRASESRRVNAAYVGVKRSPSRLGDLDADNLRGPWQAGQVERKPSATIKTKVPLLPHHAARNAVFASLRLSATPPLGPCTQRSS
jgi:hypothetical protein